VPSQERGRGACCTIVDKAAARDIVGEDNIRFYGGGIPDVFLDAGGQAIAGKLEQLLNWCSTPT